MNEESGTKETAQGRPRVLVSLWPGLGDVMFATPAIRQLREAVPHAYVAAISLDGGPGRDLLETNPYLDEVFFPAGGSVYSKATRAECVGWAKERRFDVGIELSFPVDSFFRAAGITETHRFGRRALWWLAPYRDKRGREVHAARHFLVAVEEYCGPLDAGGLSYDLVLTDEDRESARAALRGLTGERFVAVHPGARCNRNKRWSLSRFVELCRRLIEEKGLRVAVVGGPEDELLAEVIRSKLGDDVLPLAGRMTLRETAAVVEKAELYVGNDSGPLHVAASTGTPIVAVFGSSNPANFGPLSERSSVVQPEDDCVPCLHFPGYMWLPWGLRLRYYNRCTAMENLGVEPVYGACEEMLGAGGGGSPGDAGAEGGG